MTTREGYVPGERMMEPSRSKRCAQDMKDMDASEERHLVYDRKVVNPFTPHNILPSDTIYIAMYTDLDGLASS
uniref:Uncharacterized protein n=1 Tax=Arion vulgaris TaxID=1028688 RepID=A0A0B7B3S8_9EUPU